MGYVISMLCKALRSKVTNYMTSNFYLDASKAMVDGFCPKFQESSRICSMKYPSVLKLLCGKETVDVLCSVPTLTFCS